AGLPYTLSTMATRSIEEVAGVSGGPKWFQVYVWRDRGLVKDLLARAATAGYEAIVITVDTAVLGRRERDVRHGFTLPPQIPVRGRCCTRGARGPWGGPARSRSRPSRGGVRPTAVRRSRWPVTSTASSIRRCPGETWNGFGQSGAGPSC